jgi:hypothetical protein
LIQDYADALFDKNVLLVSAENIRGDPAFKNLVLDPPTSEREFTNLWKLYFVTLIAQALLEYEIMGSGVDRLKAILEDNSLLPTKTTTLGSILKAAQITEIGFFEQGGLRDNPSFWVPFIYRHYLDLVQGRAESTLV